MILCFSDVTYRDGFLRMRQRVHYESRPWAYWDFKIEIRQRQKSSSSIELA